DPTFSKAVKRVRKVALEAYEHQDVPFEKLVEELHPRRDIGRNPLFQVIFQLYKIETAEDATESAADTEHWPSHMEVETGTAKFDLRCDLAGGFEGLTGFLEYNSDLFEGATVERMAGHLLTLLESVTAHPDQPISRLAILTESERRRLLVDWNATATVYPRDRSIQHLFERQALRRPEAVAVVYRERQITYSDLNAAANR